MPVYPATGGQMTVPDSPVSLSVGRAIREICRLVSFG